MSRCDQKTKVFTLCASNHAGMQCLEISDQGTPKSEKHIYDLTSSYLLCEFEEKYLDLYGATDRMTRLPSSGVPDHDENSLAYCK